MLKLFFLAFLAVGLASAYSHNDFAWESSYHSPGAVSDTLLDNCNRLIDPAICDAARNDSLNVDQKKGLILDGMNPDASYPDYSFVGSWNSNVTFTKFAPAGTTIRNSGSIKDGWVRIIDLWPSAVLDNQTLLNRTGTIRSEFGFTFVVPDRKLPGDCKTVYLPQGYDYTLDTSLNGTRINSGNSKTANYSLSNQNNTFRSTLSVESNYLIKRHHWVTHCSRSGCWTTCDYYRTDNVVDRLNISDVKTAQLYNFTKEIKSVVDWRQNNLTDFWYSINLSDDFSSYNFESGNSTIRVNGVDYQLKYDLAPYNILTYEAIRREKQSSTYGISILNESTTENNLTFYQKMHLLFPTAGNCTLNIASHFEKFQYPNFCNYTNATPIISLRVVERTNDTIRLEVSFSEEERALSGKNILITFGSLQRTIRTDVTGNATFDVPAKGNGIITAEFITDLETKSAKTVFVIPQETPDVASILLSLLGSLVLLYLIQKLLGRLSHAN